MDILVLVMLALLLAMIAFSIVLFVILRKNSVTKSFNNKIDSDISDDDLDLDDDHVGNIVLPSNFFNHENSKPVNEELVQAQGDALEKVEDVKVKEVSEEISRENVELNVEETPVIPIVPVTSDDSKENNNNKERIEELVNILIDKKNYIFLANNYKLEKNEHIKLIVDNKVYFGTVMKANYTKDIKTLKSKPRKLILVEKKKKKNVVNNEDLDIIPIKKNKNESKNN